MKAHVICMNDKVEYVIAGNVAASYKKMEKLKCEYYKKNTHRFDGPEEYDNTCFWHIHTVPMEFIKP